jgi:MFS family permease
MNWKELFNLRGINFWWLASGVGLNLSWAVVVLLFIFRVLSAGIDTVENMQLVLMVGFFIGPLVIGWLIGRWADDGRGPTYGLIGSIGSLVLILYAVLPSGPLGLLVALVALAGGLNGGLLSQRRRRPE